MICSAFFAISVEYSSDAPAGACTTAMKYPSSSCGTNDEGTIWNTVQVANSPPANSSSIT